MTTAQEEILALLEALPDDVTFEDVPKTLIVLYDIQRGLEQLDRGEVIPHEEAKRRIRRLLGSSLKPEG